MICSKRRLINTCGAGLLACALVYPHDVITTKITWSREISRLTFERCVTCHREGGTAFSLTTYEAARPWAKAIKEEVNERRMPPWGAVKGFGEFKDDQGLTQEQIELINDWVEGGAPEGDPALLPKDVIPSPPQTHSHGPETIVDGEVTLKAPMMLKGIRPATIPEGASLQVIAERPDGSIEPLLWLYNYNPKFQHPFFYRKEMKFPAGTKVEVTPTSGGTVALMPSTSTPKPGP